MNEVARFICFQLLSHMVTVNISGAPMAVCKMRMYLLRVHPRIQSISFNYILPALTSLLIETARSKQLPTSVFIEVNEGRLEVKFEMPCD